MVVCLYRCKPLLYRLAWRTLDESRLKIVSGFESLLEFAMDTVKDNNMQRREFREYKGGPLENSRRVTSRSLLAPDRGTSANDLRVMMAANYGWR